MPGVKSDRVLVAAGALAALIGVVQFEKLARDKSILKPYDFVEYWSAGRQLLDGKNPYDPDALIQMQRPMYDGVIKAIMMWNPPWALPVTLPFAALPWRLAQFLWLGVQFASVTLSVDVFWRLYGGGRRYRWASWLIALTFAPTLFLLFMGQITGLMLLGLAGFLYFRRRQRPILSGCVAALTALKPHHLSLFALVLLLESWPDRRIRRTVLAGAVTLTIASILPLLWNPHVWGQYFEATHRPDSDTFESMSDFAHSTVGYWLRTQIPGEPFAAMFVPIGVAILATALYWRRHREEWTWESALPVLTLASLLVTPYGAWAFDMVLLLLPLIRMAVWLKRTRAAWFIDGAILLSLILNGLTLMTIRDVGSQSNPWIVPIVATAYLIVAIARNRI
jgi:hypothetical protein